MEYQPSLYDIRPQWLSKKMITKKQLGEKQRQKQKLKAVVVFFKSFKN